MEEMRRIIKQKIPAEIRFKIWETYVGNKIESLCFCCKIKKITPFTSYKSFQAGHIKSENDGGFIKIGNLLPICASCNRKMSTRHWDDFVKEKKYFIRVHGDNIPEIHKQSVLLIQNVYRKYKNKKIKKIKKKRKRKKNVTPNYMNPTFSTLMKRKIIIF